MADKAYEYMNWSRMEAVVYGEENLPREILGAHLVRKGILIQCFFPNASGVTVHVKDKEKDYEMTQEDEAGYFALLIPGKEIPEYVYLVKQADGTVLECEDPYRFGSMLPEKEERAFCEGVSYQIYKKMGAHPMTRRGVKGVYFSIWAPNAGSVSVVGDFNQWDGRIHLMHKSAGSGIYELFIPTARPGDLYKYEISMKNGTRVLRTDPYAMEREKKPGIASVVPETREFSWEDGSWLKERRQKGALSGPVSICEISLMDWGRQENGSYLNYRELAERISAYVAEMGFTHIELDPVMEFEDEGGGGYATSGYFAPTSRFGRPVDFKYFVNTLHKKQVGVLMDWTPAHFPGMEGGMAYLDGTCLYEYSDPKKGVHPLWNTKIFNFESPMVREFLIGNALYWIEQFHIDGLRMDDVDAMLYLDYGRTEGNWIPNIYGSNENLEAIDFLKILNTVVKKEHPDVMLIAQEDGLWPSLTGAADDTHMGFDYKWNNGWTGGLLDYLRREEKERFQYHDELTTSMLYAYRENYVLTLNRRDVISPKALMSSLPGKKSQRLALTKAAYGYQMTHPGRKMLVVSENIREELEEYLRSLLGIYREYPALYQMDGDPEGFEWIQLMEAEKKILVFLRKTERIQDTLLVACNFSSESYRKYAIGVPYPGKYKEILNSDDERFGGNGFINVKARCSREQECNERLNSITVKLAPLSVSVFTYKEFK